MSNRRILSDIKKCLNLENFELIDTGNTNSLNITYTPYMSHINYKLTLQINIPINYPFAPPQVIFTSKVFHPNVDNNGKICIELLDKWQSNYTLSKVLQELHLLYTNPNLDNPVNIDAVSVWSNLTLGVINIGELIRDMEKVSV